MLETFSALISSLAGEGIRETCKFSLLAILYWSIDGEGDTRFTMGVRPVHYRDWVFYIHCVVLEFHC